MAQTPASFTAEFFSRRTTQSHRRVTAALLAAACGLTLASALLSAPPASGPSPGELADKPDPCTAPTSPGQGVTPDDTDTHPQPGGGIVHTPPEPSTCSLNWQNFYDGIIYAPPEVAPEPRTAFNEIANGKLILPPVGSVSFAAEMSVPVAANFNSNQPVCSGTSKPGDSPQGVNWFQTSRPEMVVQYAVDEMTKDADDRVYVLTGANAWLDLKRFDDDSDTFVGVNGTTGVMVHTDRSTSEFDTYEYHGRGGEIYTFIGGDFDDSDNAGAKWQLWKIENADGESAALYTSDTQGTVTKASALGAFESASGLLTPRATTMFDSAGRKYAYTYTTINGTRRLESVEVTEHVGMSDVLRGEVEYGYYSSTDSGKGLDGYLKTATVTTVLSPSNSTEVPNTSTLPVLHRRDVQLLDEPGSPGPAQALARRGGVPAVRAGLWWLAHGRERHRRAAGVLRRLDGDLRRRRQDLDDPIQWRVRVRRRFPRRGVRVLLRR